LLINYIFQIAHHNSEVSTLSLSVQNMDLTIEDDSEAENNKLFNARLRDFSEFIKYHQFLTQLNLTDIRKVKNILFRHALEEVDNIMSIENQLVDFKGSLVSSFSFYKIKYFIKESKTAQGQDFVLIIKCRNSQQKREKNVCSCTEYIKINFNKNDPDAVNKAVLMLTG
jgi:hypothetical protein